MLQHGTNSEDFMLSLSQKDKCHIILLHEASSRAGSRWQVLGGWGAGVGYFGFMSSESLFKKIQISGPVRRRVKEPLWMEKRLPTLALLRGITDSAGWSCRPAFLLSVAFGDKAWCLRQTRPHPTLSFGLSLRTRVGQARLV